jgi:hypothetical protein
METLLLSDPHPNHGSPSPGKLITLLVDTILVIDIQSIETTNDD